MTLRSDLKDELTNKIRHIIAEKISIATENDRAEASLCTLSFQSKTNPERQIWLDTDGEKITIDLEDWQNETEWDNALARLSVDSVEELLELIQAWLSGSTLKEYSNVNKDYQKVEKELHIL